MNTRDRRRLSAFTIVELLIASTITVIIVVMLGTMFGSLSSTSLRANQRIDAFRDARAALQMIQRDLAGVVRSQWDMRANPPTPMTRPAAYLALTDRYADPATGNQQVFALIAAKNAGRGDLCAIGYYCRWDPTQRAYSLRRYFRDSNELMADASFFDAAGRSVPPWNIRNYAGPFVLPNDLYQPSDAEAPSANPPTFKDEVLASYVWDLRISAYDSAGAPLTYPLVVDMSAASPGVAPASATISFKAMSSNAARAVTAAGIGPDVWMDETHADYQRLIRPHVYEFSSQIRL